jgi:hypothetical protein
MVLLFQRVRLGKVCGSYPLTNKWERGPFEMVFLAARVLGETVGMLHAQGLDCVRFFVIFFALATYNIRWAAVLQERFGDGVAGRILASGGAVGILLATAVVLSSIYGRYTLLRRLFQDSTFVVAILLPGFALANGLLGSQWLTVPTAILIGGLASGCITLAMGRESSGVFLRHSDSSLFPRVRAIGSLGYLCGVASVPQLQGTTFWVTGATLALLMAIPRRLPDSNLHRSRLKLSNSVSSNSVSSNSVSSNSVSSNSVSSGSGTLWRLWPILLCAFVFPNCAKTFDSFNALLLVPRPDWLQLFSMMIALEIALLLAASTSLGRMIRSRWVILASAGLWVCGYACLTSERTLFLGVMFVAGNCLAQTMMQLKVGDAIRHEGDTSGTAQSALQVMVALGNSASVLPIYFATAKQQMNVGPSVWYTGMYMSLAVLPVLILCVLRFPQGDSPAGAHESKLPMVEKWPEAAGQTASGG